MTWWKLTSIQQRIQRGILILKEDSQEVGNSRDVTWKNKVKSQHTSGLRRGGRTSTKSEEILDREKRIVYKIQK